ncbi:MAG: hypothetical protein GXP33_06675 [Spirochaetes bacterium]|nr:hypothetical protein [Spirochaetota bacterium]
MENGRTLLEGLIYYGSIILKYWKFIIITTGVTAVLITAFSILSIRLPPDKSPLPNYYRAYAVVVFQEGKGGTAGMSSMLAAFGVENPGGSGNSAQLAMQVLGSRPFIDNVIKKFNIIERLKIKDKYKTNSRRFILNNSQYSYNRDSGSLTISFTNNNPSFAADIVNYEVNLLEQWFLKEGITVRSKQLSIMEEKLGELTSEISKIEDSIEAFQKKHGVLDITEIATAQSAMLTDLRTRLNQVELKISDYTKYSNIEDPALATLKDQRSNIITQIHRIENGYTSSDGLKMPSQKDLPELSLNFAHMKAELMLKNQLFRTLSERYEVTKLVSSQENVFSVLEYAEIPDEKEGPHRGKLCIKAVLGAFAGSIILALLFNMIKNYSRNLENNKIREEKK